MSTAGSSLVLLCAFSKPQVEALRLHLPPELPLRSESATDAALRILETESVDVLCLGDSWSVADMVDFLRRASALDVRTQRLDLVLAAGPEPEAFQEFIDVDRIFYLSPSPPPPVDTARLLLSAWHLRDGGAGSKTASVDGLDQARRVLQATRPAANATADELPTLARQVIEQLMTVQRADCLLFDALTETLWAPASGLLEERRESAAAGLVSYVVRTGSPVRLEAAGEDPRYDAEADNGGDDPAQRFLAVPIPSLEGNQTLGVLVALRNPDDAPFGEDDERLLQTIAARLAPAVDREVLQATFDALASHPESTQGPNEDLFRREALEHYFQDAQDQGHLLQLSPRWTQWTYPVLLSLVAAALVFSLVASVHEYADGTALVRVEGRDDIVAPLSGTVSAIEVRPGQRVEAGELLVGLYSAQEAAELERLEQEFQLGLLNRLRHPADPNVERALGALQARKRQAEARLEERSVRAPRPGVVSDVRVRPGQPLTPGEVVLTLQAELQEPSIVAVFPGHYRPLIQIGMPLRLELEGYRYAYQRLTVDGITDEVFGPAEARRLLGPGGDTVPLSGPVVLVTARLPSDTFESDGRRYAYHDGISGRAEIRVRSERLITTLVPALETVLPSSTP